MVKSIVLSMLAVLMLWTSGWTNSFGGSQVNVHFTYSNFYDDLDAYGSWIDYGSYGRCWTPGDVGHTWRPYSDGYWTYTEYGWTWVSFEPYGWAVYHYGRWAFDPVFGWVWVPGSEWAPAWVAWSYGDPWIGWAPLPPTAVWNVSYGLSWDSGHRVPASNWCFVQRGDFMDTNLRTRIAPVARNQKLLVQTQDVTRYDRRGDRPVNRGPEVASVERTVGRKIRHATITDVDSPDRARQPGKRAGSVTMFRPEVRAEGPRRVRQELNVSRSPAEIRTEKPKVRQMQDLERSLAQERARLSRAHQDELRSRPRGTAREEIRRRHDQENKAFERRAVEQRRGAEERAKKQLVKPEKGKGQPSQDRQQGSKRSGSGKSG